MLNFNDLQLLCAKSYFIKYGAYVLPFLFYLFIKIIWKKYNSNVVNISNLILTKNSDTTENIETDTKINNVFDNELLKPHLPERDHIPYKGIGEWLDKSGEQFYKIANNRRSIRKFAKNKPVDFNVIQKCILAAGRYTSRFKYIVHKLYTYIFAINYI